MDISFKTDLIERISELINYTISDVYRNMDCRDSFDGIPSGYPLIMFFRKPQLILILPDTDYQQLEEGKISIEDYISTSYFSYGYTWGTSFFKDIYWQPLENGPGIHDKDLIGRYLRILKCRTDQNSNDNLIIHAETCKSCPLDEQNCPLSPLNLIGCWENEVEEPDGRILLLNAIKERVEMELGFVISYFILHKGKKDKLELGFDPVTNKVGASVSRELIYSLLYHPDKNYHWSEIAQNLSIILTCDYQEENNVKIRDAITNKHEFCLSYWGYKAPESKSSKAKFLQKFFG